MLRGAALIAAAIAAVNPSLPEATRLSYAHGVELAARRAQVDPLLIVAIIHGESRWQPGLVGGLDGACVGLGQVCLHIYPECRDGFETPACAAKREQLRDPFVNLAMIGVHLSKWRTWCFKKTHHRPHAKNLLFAYGGWNSPSRNLWCGMTQRHGKWVEAPTPKTVRRTLSTYLNLRRLVQVPHTRSKS